MKKIDKLVFGAFLGPFLMTFLVVVFILLMQHMLKYFDDIIGKGLDWDVIGQLLFYFAIFMTPVAMPLAVLLSSLIAFGNLGEHFELTAIKSAGISLVRALLPIFVFVVLLTGVAFYANNNLVPKAALEAYSLLYDIKQKKPALDLREGAFYTGINDISIKVNKKFPDGITLKDVVVYDHRKNDGNKDVTVADSGKMYTILNERYLKFELFKGYMYAQTSAQRELDGSRRVKGSPESYSRRKFEKMQFVFDLSSFNLERTDKKWFQGNRIMRNLSELTYDMDSIRGEILGQRLSFYEYQGSYFTFLYRDRTYKLPLELERYKHRKDSLMQAEYTTQYNEGSQKAARADSVTATSPPKDSVAKDSTRIVRTDSLGTGTVKRDSAAVDSGKIATNRTDSAKQTRTSPKVVTPAPRKTVAEKNRLRERKTAQRRKPIIPSKGEVTKMIDRKRESISTPVKVLSDSARAAKLDSVFEVQNDRGYYEAALTAARQVKTQVMNSNTSIGEYQKEWITFNIQWHKILASSMACIVMFLIGAPLGAIIKKGGLGMPFLVSILFFIIYYVLTMQGEKLAKQGTITPAMGVWMADFILFFVGLIFLRTARADARLFEADFYSVLFDRVQRWFARKRKPKQSGLAG